MFLKKSFLLLLQQVVIARAIRKVLKYFLSQFVMQANNVFCAVARI